MLHLRGPEDNRDRKREAEPKLVSKHRHGVTGVTVMALVALRHAVRMCIRGMLVLPVGPVIHGATSQGKPGSDCPNRTSKTISRYSVMPQAFSMLFKVYN